MIHATLNYAGTLQNVTLTYDVATCLRDDADVQRRLTQMGVTVTLHFPTGDTVDNVPDLLKIAGDLADQVRNDAAKAAAYDR